MWIHCHENSIIFQTVTYLNAVQEIRFINENWGFIKYYGLIKKLHLILKGIIKNTAFGSYLIARTDISRPTITRNTIIFN